MTISTNSYSAVPALAKKALIDSAQGEYLELTATGRVCDQMNAIAILDVIEELESMNLANAYMLAKSIDEAEAFDGDRFREVSPMDFLAFEGSPVGGNRSELGALI